MEGVTTRLYDPERIMEVHERAAVTPSRNKSKWHAKNAIYVSSYLRAYRERNREKILAQKREHYAKNRERLLAQKKLYTEKVSAYVIERRRKQRQSDPNKLARHNFVQALRRKAEARATPNWADMHGIEEMYCLAQHLSVETGTKHSVDHLFPLQGKTICGLHVHDNLRVIPLLDNCKKYNRSMTDDMV